MLTTTLNEILEHRPCIDGWVKLTGQSKDKGEWVGNDERITFESILESNGFIDALWACRVLTGDNLKRFKLFICDIAERSLVHVPVGEEAPRVVIETARNFLNGEATKDELVIARRAYAIYATDATDAAVYAADTAYAAVYAADAVYAAVYAADDAECEARIEMFKHFLNDTN